MGEKHLGRVRVKINVFFYLNAEKAENFSHVVFKPVELNLADKFLIYAMVHKLSSVEPDIWFFLV